MNATEQGSTDPEVLVVMGVAGSGKTTFGRALAGALGWRFLDGDDIHPPANLEKMGRGEALTDEERGPWLAELRRRIEIHLEEGQPLVMACSALKRSYREKLAEGEPAVQFIYLQGDFETIQERMLARRGHFMKADMLRSQFETLEEPREALVVDIRGEVDGMVAAVLARLGDEQ